MRIDLYVGWGEQHSQTGCSSPGVGISIEPVAPNYRSRRQRHPFGVNASQSKIRKLTSRWNVLHQTHVMYYESI